MVSVPQHVCDGIVLRGHGALGGTVPFLLDTIPLELEGGRYVGLLLPMYLAELVSGICNSDSSNGGGRATEGT